MLSRIARGAPRFSITSERRSISTRCRSLPKLVRARKADTTILLFFWVFAIGTNSSVGLYELYSSFATGLMKKGKIGGREGARTLTRACKDWSHEQSTTPQKLRCVRQQELRLR